MAEELTGEKLTYPELVEILANLAGRIDHLENALINFLEVMSEQSEFATIEIFKAQMSNMKQNRRTPYKMLIDMKHEVEILKGGLHGLYEKREKNQQYNDYTV